MDSFTPFSIDVSPLQKFLLTLARQVRQHILRLHSQTGREQTWLFAPSQVEQLQADNAALREELAGLKVRAWAMSGSFSKSTETSSINKA
jgi:hypothetical protein